MTDRGQQTVAKLVEATRQVVREVGYANTTTRRIADAAGVTEGTIYRHFPTKRALLMAAAMDANPQVMAEMSSLPDLAGQATVEENLHWALSRLATLRADMMPLELALLTEPELAPDGEADGPRAAVPALMDADHPPDLLASYLAAEQRQGRVRDDVDPVEASLVLLILLFGTSVSPPESRRPDLHTAIGSAVRLVVYGLAT